MSYRISNNNYKYSYKRSDITEIHIVQKCEKERIIIAVFKKRLHCLKHFSFLGIISNQLDIGHKYQQIRLMLLMTKSEGLANSREFISTVIST